MSSLDLHLEPAAERARIPLDCCDSLAADRLRRPVPLAQADRARVAHAALRSGLELSSGAAS